MREIALSWSDATKRRLPRYRSLKRCPKEHEPIRYTSTRGCIECSRIHARCPQSIQRAKDWYAKFSHREKMLHWAKYRHVHKGYPGVFNLQVSDIEWPDVCPALGIKLYYAAQRDRNADDAPTLDRINPALGYVTGNVQILSRKANRIKNDGSAEEVMRVALFMAGGQ